MQQRKWQHFAAIVLINVFFVPVLFADTEEDHTSPWHTVVTVSGGAAFSTDVGVSKYVPPRNGNFSFYNYDTQHPNQEQAIFGGFVGAERAIRAPWLLQLGIGYYQPSSFKATGRVTQGTDIASENQYTYQYFIQSYQLVGEGKLLYTNASQYHPYLAGGLGIAWNAVSNYNVKIEPPFTAFTNQFQHHTTPAFMYSAGFGLDVDMPKNLRLGIGYRFINFGRARTGQGIIDDVPTGTTLSQSHLYVNVIEAQLSFVVM